MDPGILAGILACSLKARMPGPRQRHVCEQLAYGCYPTAYLYYTACLIGLRDSRVHGRSLALATIEVEIQTRKYLRLLRGSHRDRQCAEDLYNK